MAKKDDTQEPTRRKGVIGQHRDRLENDSAYREAALTPPGNHPPGGHVDDVQRTADGAAADGS